MGMAAGQARLLSITSRMSDNELRAQIINNDKMRLATQSSQVSEAYVTALNEAQMMFTNYDANNNTSYQKLTFNALTAYNPYNNQYILTNPSGNVLLSEQDAINYKNANGDVTKFLKSYGLEHTTTYWDSLAVYADGEQIQYKTDATVSGVDLIEKPEDYNGTVNKYLKDLYEGTMPNDNGNPKIHPGYMDAVSSNEYYLYTSALVKYNEKLDELLPTIKTGMDDKLSGLEATPNGSSSSVKFSDIDPANWGEDIGKAKNDMDALSKIIENAKTYVIDDSAKEWLDSVKKIVDANKGDTMPVEILTPENSRFDTTTIPGTLKLLDSDGKEIFTITKDLLGNYSGTHVTSKDEDGNPASSASLSTLSTSPLQFQFLAADGATNITIDGIKSSYFTSTPTDYEITETQPNKLENMKSVTNDVIDELKTAIYNIWNPMHKTGSNFTFMDTSSDEYTEFTEAANELYSAVGLGTSCPSDKYFELGSIEFIHDELKGKPGENAFEKVYDAYILDCIMNTFGEPKYTWIDTSNKYPDPSSDSSFNENGEAKAQWYENLFARIQSGGYKVLQDGLASSNEWIQFAFESGIVTMEQVDANKNWQPLIYSNCSDITEQTNDAAIAKAEAEYKSAMNKIENKDKRYDLELKNIDTEHNSLQTEYDSIKTAIDKNIERTFKLYS